MTSCLLPYTPNPFWKGSSFFPFRVDLFSEGRKNSFDRVVSPESVSVLKLISDCGFNHWCSQKGIIFTHTQEKSQKLCLELLPKSGLLFKERICSKKEQLLSFKSSPYGKEAKCFMLIPLYHEYFSYAYYVHVYDNCNKNFLNNYSAMGKFSRWQLDDIFLTFPRNRNWYIMQIVSLNCLLRIQFAWSVKSYFLGKIRKTIYQNVICGSLYLAIISTDLSLYTPGNQSTCTLSEYYWTINWPVPVDKLTVCKQTPEAKVIMFTVSLYFHFTFCQISETVICCGIECR